MSVIQTRTLPAVDLSQPGIKLKYVTTKHVDVSGPRLTDEQIAEAEAPSKTKSVTTGELGKMQARAAQATERAIIEEAMEVAGKASQDKARKDAADKRKKAKT